MTQLIKSVKREDIFHGPFRYGSYNIMRGNELSCTRKEVSLIYLLIETKTTITLYPI